MGCNSMNVCVQGWGNGGGEELVSTESVVVVVTRAISCTRIFQKCAGFAGVGVGNLQQRAVSSRALFAGLEGQCLAM